MCVQRCYRAFLYMRAGVGSFWGDCEWSGGVKGDLLLR